MLVTQLEEGRCATEIEYDRVVNREGNKKAQSIISEVFEPADSQWRGIGTIPKSGLAIREAYAGFDAARRFDIPAGVEKEPAGCRCGSVLKGLITPDECPLFGKSCTTGTPVGPCMVSSEGTCSAYYKYRKVS